jgi:hypothetical protein
VHTLEGDGILAVFDLQSVVEIRSKEQLVTEPSPDSGGIVSHPY